MQLQVWCLTEGGAVMGKTIRERDWKENPENELMDLNGYVKNPLHLPGAEGRLVEAIVADKKDQLERVTDLKETLEKVGDTEDESYEDVCKSEELLTAEIAEKEESQKLSERELGQYGEAFADAVEVENFLLNLGSERSKKKIWKFLDDRAIAYSKDLL